MFLMAAPANADLTTKMSTSIQLNVEGAAIVSERIGSSYSITGSNITTNDGTTSNAIGGLDMSTITGGVPNIQDTTYSITNSGDAFSFSESLTVGDTIVTGQTAVTSGQIDQANIYGETTTQIGGTAGALAGTIGSDGVMTITAGGSGTTATGQFVSEITVK